MNPPEEIRMRHRPFDTAAFVFGTLFVLVAVLGLLGPSITRRLDLGLLFPLAIVIIGATVLLVSLRPRDARRSGSDA
jgi:hypothetical protein